MLRLGFPGGTSGKESACSAKDLGLIRGSGRSPGEREWLPTLAFSPGVFHGQPGRLQFMGLQSGHD